ncbi:MAG: SDR family NAD(P)-dependent oxidoreductase [Burkholderiales bacterium]|nr:SDR family NAD(P)-dependent oxidoreductase [Burkholderiales bacterium]
MDTGLKGKKVLITGASKGIGLACAKAFAAEGCELHLAARDAARLEAARAEVAKVAPVAVKLTAIDLSKPGSAAALKAAAGAVDVLVNNAGAIPGGSIETIDEARWRDAWELKLFGYINLTREFLPPMLAAGKGAIVNVIGLAGAKPSYDYVCGATANAALIAFTKGVGAGATNKGVRVIGVNPTATRTDRIITLNKARAKTSLGDESRWEEMMTNLPFGRICEPEEVADLVVYCASAKASYLSGTVIDIDGGQLYR